MFVNPANPKETWRPKYYGSMDLARYFESNVIAPTLRAIDLYSDGMSRLLLGTAIHESHLESRRQKLNHGKLGRARGLFQMEPATHDEIWSIHLRRNPIFADKIKKLLSSPAADKIEELETNDQYAAAMAAAKYQWKHVVCPSTDPKELAEIWKRVYNTSAGKGTTAEFIRDWKRFMGTGAEELSK